MFTLLKWLNTNTLVSGGHNARVEPTSIHYGSNASKQLFVTLCGRTGGEHQVFSDSKDHTFLSYFPRPCVNSIKNDCTTTKTTSPPETSRLHCSSTLHLSRDHELLTVSVHRKQNHSQVKEGKWRLNMSVQWLGNGRVPVQVKVGLGFWVEGLYKTWKSRNYRREWVGWQTRCTPVCTPANAQYTWKCK